VEALLPTEPGSGLFCDGGVRNRPIPSVKGVPDNRPRPRSLVWLGGEGAAF
jgi:hypothetical protein